MTLTRSGCCSPEGRAHLAAVDFAAALLGHGADPEQVQHVCRGMSAAYAWGLGLALRNAAIRYDRFHVVAIAFDAMDKVRQAEMRDAPDAVAKAFGTLDRKTIKGLLWGMRKNPDGWSIMQTNAMRWLQHSGLKSARAWRLKIAPREVYARAAASSDPQFARANLNSLVELDQALPARAVQEAGPDDGRTHRCRGAGNDRQANQRLRRSHEPVAAAGQARRTGLPHGNQLYRQRLPANVQAQASARSSVCSGARQMRSLRSTRNGIAPLETTANKSIQTHNVASQPFWQTSQFPTF
jgi:hypothetical protein